jgi:hypothetical protein
MRDQGIRVECRFCGKLFRVGRAVFSKGMVKWCSRECRDASTRQAWTCERCGVVFHRAWSLVKSRTFCSNACYRAIQNTRAPLEGGMTICGCGCRGTFPTVKRDRTSGILQPPRRFIVGHGHRKHPYVETPGARACECGCGEIVQPHLGHRGRWARFIKGHGSRRPPQERLMAQIICYLPTRCWLWTGARDSHSYGLMSGRRVHRLVFELERSVTLDPGQLLRHGCDVRACCRPDHLEVGTPKENAGDMLARGRSRGLWSGVPKHLSNTNLSRLALPG